MGLLVLRYFDFECDNGESRVSFVLSVCCCYLIDKRQAVASDANGGAHDKRRRRRQRRRQHHVATPLEQPPLWHFVECRVARSDRTEIRMMQLMVIVMQIVIGQYVEDASSVGIYTSISASQG